MTTHMTPDAQTQAIPGVPTTVVAVRDSEVAPDPEAEDARTEWVQEKYEAALAKLDALHDRWAAATADNREAQTSGEPGEAAA